MKNIGCKDTMKSSYIKYFKLDLLDEISGKINSVLYH